MSRSDNLAVYWGQTELALSELCKDDTVDSIPISFLTYYDGSKNTMQINLSNNVKLATVLPNSALLDASELTDGIIACQKKGKILTISMGGATGNIQLKTEDDAKTFAELVYNTFLGGSEEGTPRPFGKAILDGVDLDIEGGGTPYWIQFADHLRDFATSNNDSKHYYITGAPQCPYPDGNMKDVLNGTRFDAIYVQFYNNYCGVANWDKDGNFGDWVARWAIDGTFNKESKIYIGAPASPEQANPGSYVDIDRLAQIVRTTRGNETIAPYFGGVMLWEAGGAVRNHHYHKAIKAILLEDVQGAKDTPSSSI